MSLYTAAPPAVRPLAAGGAGHIVVVADRTAAVPPWAAEWSAWSGRELLLQPVDAPAGAGPCAVSGAWAEAVTDAAAHAARVLALRTTGRPPRPRSVVAAVRDLPDDVLVVADAAENAARLGAALALVHGVPMSFGERSVDLRGALDHGRRLLDAAARQVAVREPGLRVTARLLRARPHELVGEDIDADLLVLGGPRAGRSGGLGLVARSALHHAPCPVLLVPRPV
jgi:nucleotide-binding universal stress UspA family protein